MRPTLASLLVLALWAGAPGTPKGDVPAGRLGGGGPRDPSLRVEHILPSPAPGRASRPPRIPVPPPAPGPAPAPVPIPPIRQPVAEIVASAEALARSSVPAARALAWDLAGVLRKHPEALEERGLSLPDALTSLQAPPRPDPGDPTDDELRLIAAQTGPVLRAALAWDPGRPPEATCPPRLGVAILRTVAAGCPSASARVEAAIALADAALPDAEGKRYPDPAYSEDAALAAACEAIDRALARLAAGAGDDAALAAWRIGSDLLAKELTLRALVSEAASATGLERRAAEVESAIGSAAKSAEEEASKSLLGRAGAQAKALRGRAGQIVRTAASRREVRTLVDRFVTAVNTEHREAALACLAPEAAERYKGARSLRAAFTGQADTRTVVLLRVGWPFQVGEQVRVAVQYARTDTAKRESLGVADLPLVRAQGGWRIGKK